MNNKTQLSSDHSQKARMIAAQLRRYIDAIEGRSNLKVGLRMTIAPMDAAADLLERMCLDRTRGRRTTADKMFMKKHHGKFFIRQGSILVNRAFDTAKAAQVWARENYRSDIGWTLLSERLSLALEPARGLAPRKLLP